MEIDHRVLSLKFKRLLESVPGIKSTEANKSEWEELEFISASVPTDEKKPNKADHLWEAVQPNCGECK